MKQAKIGRCCDLDALRGIAMVLGIVLPASLASFPCPWPAQDSHQQHVPAIVYAAIHGFRMPLFFLLSGFFTAMVAQRRRGSAQPPSAQVLPTSPLVLAAMFGKPEVVRGVLASTVVILRATYRWCVRSTLSGSVSNGPKWPPACPSGH